MPPFGPVKRKDMIRYFGQLGFECPYSGGKHQFMIKDDLYHKASKSSPVRRGKRAFEQNFTSSWNQQR